jgi:beta-lactamase superfamily II metal-dependent hydrolase
MLVDCGVHSHGRVKVDGVSRPIGFVVDAIIDHLRSVSPEERPRLDVVVATHHHADHISGFALEAWQEVDVAEVWVPFVEDRSDADAHRIRMGLQEAAGTLRSIVESTHGLDSNRWSPELRLVHGLATNALGNADAADRLLGRNGRRFARDPANVRVRYLPASSDADAGSDVDFIDIPVEGAHVRVIGPSRDPQQLKRMDPPVAVSWLALAHQERHTQGLGELFDPVFRVSDDEAKLRLGRQTLAARNGLRLKQLAHETEDLLAASSLLERSVNNTSVAFVLDVSGARFLFVGDSQQGAWEHILAQRAELDGLVFYKVGHHGSHNSTPKSFVTDVLPEASTAMLPYSLVKAWKDTIPKRELLDALAAKSVRLVRADEPSGEGVVLGPGALWSEVTFDLP